MSALPIQTSPSSIESASGYLLRLLAANGESIKVLQAARHGDECEAFASLSGSAPDWFRHRLPAALRCDGWAEVALFGLHWREPWLLRGPRQQICPACLSQRGIAHMAWDLIPYVACHIHGVVLQDRCTHCGGAIRNDRPSLTVCDCGAILINDEERLVPASPLVVALSSRLAAGIGDEAAAGKAPIHRLVPSLYGTSPDGAYRLVQAFSGGNEAFRTALIASRRSWLPSIDAHRLLHSGLAKLAGFVGLEAHERQAVADALDDQQLGGITAWDRAAAARALTRLAKRPRRRLDALRPSWQMDLFPEELRQTTTASTGAL